MRMPCLQKELKEIERDKASGVTIKVVGSSLQKLIGYVQGMPRARHPGLALQPATLSKQNVAVHRSCCVQPLHHALLDAVRELHLPELCSIPTSLSAWSTSAVLQTLTASSLLAGPRDTPYEGGVFIVDIELGASQAATVAAGTTGADLTQDCLTPATCAAARVAYSLVQATSTRSCRR